MEQLKQINSHDFMGKNGFYWWVGVVERTDGDPLNLNRAKVRIFGHHPLNRNVVPTEDLPWVLPLAPLNNPSGVKSPPPSTWVLGFFLDGSIGQQPVMIGAFVGLRYKECVDAPQLDAFGVMEV